MQLQVLATLAAASAASVSAVACNTTEIASLLASDDVVTCSSDSGYSFTSLTTPTDAEIAAMCDDEACQSALAALEALDLGNCTVASFAIMSDLVDPLVSTCNGSATGSSGSASTSASSSSQGITIESVGGDSGSTSAGSATWGGNGTSSTTSSASSDSGGVNGTAIVIASAGTVVLVLFTAAFYLCYWKRERGNAQASRQSTKSAYLPAITPVLDGEKGRTTDPSYFVSVKSPVHAASLKTAALWNDPVVTATRIPLNGIRLEGCISHGGFGEVHRGVYRGRLVAVKMLLRANRKDMTQINAFLSEIKLAATLDHPNIVTFVGVAWQALVDLCSVTEFMEGGDLRTLLTKHKRDGRPVGLDSTKLRIGMQVALALTYMHSLSPMVLHRDLKSRNVMLTAQLEAKVTDFGVSKERLDKTLTAGVGTLLWMAPEVIMGERYDEKADLFSFGVMLSELDTHELPYEKARRTHDGRLLPDVSVMQLVVLGRLRVEFSPGIPSGVQKLVASCVSIDPKERPTAAQAAYEMSKALKSARLT